MMRDRDLRASLQLIGALTTGYSYAGEVFDGRRRLEICTHLGIHFEVRECTTLQEACSILWTLHPARALELAAKDGKRSVLELARLCSATPLAVAQEQQANKPRKSHKRDTRILRDEPYRKLKETRKMLRRIVTFEPELYAYAKEAAAQIGHRNVNQLVRDALWKEVALRVPNAPQFQPRRVQPQHDVSRLQGARRKSG